MDRCPEVQRPYHRTPESLTGKGGAEFQVRGEGAGGRSRRAPPAVLEGAGRLSPSVICVISAGVCLAPRVSDGRRQWRLQVGQLLGQQRCNSRGSLEEREDAWGLEGAVVPAAPYLRQMLTGRKGLGALSKELWGTHGYSGRAGLPGGSGSGWARGTGREDSDVGRLGV